MTNTRRAVLATLAAAPALGAPAALASPPAADPAEASWRTLYARWRAARAAYAAACERQDAAEAAAWTETPIPPHATPAQAKAIIDLRAFTLSGAAAEAAYRESCRLGQRCLRLERIAQAKPARSLATLALKADMLRGHAEGADDPDDIADIAGASLAALAADVARLASL